MSGQASRSRARELRRRHKQVAAEIVHACWPDLHGDCVPCRGTGRRLASTGVVADEACGFCLGSGRNVDAATQAVLRGTTFNVRTVRDHAERLIASGREAIESWAVYCDWLEATGNAWAEGRTRESKVLHLAFAKGPGRVRCTVCDGGRVDMWDSTGSPVGCVCNGGLRTGPLPHSDGPFLVRLGERVLAAIDGQPSECQTCNGAPEQLVDHVPYGASILPDGSISRSYTASVVSCSDCNGTGDNLRGHLPEHVNPAHARRLTRRRRGSW